MIEKMTKYSFILLSSDTEEFLLQLQSTGMMDITRSRKPVDEKSSALLGRITDCRDTEGFLKKSDFAKDPDISGIQAAAKSAELPDTDPVRFVREQKEKLESIASAIATEKSRMTYWSPR